MFTQKHYFNSGVLLMNFDNWSVNNKNISRDKIANYLLNMQKQNAFQVLDQDILNVIFNSKKLTLSQQYNYYPGAVTKKLNAKNTTIIHMLMKKPWNISDIEQENMVTKKSAGYFINRFLWFHYIILKSVILKLFRKYNPLLFYDFAWNRVYFINNLKKKISKLYIAVDKSIQSETKYIWQLWKQKEKECEKFL
jgi:lipopolysaccharide biosynthesis glycosyltransferase